MDFKIAESRLLFDKKMEEFDPKAEGLMTVYGFQDQMDEYKEFVQESVNRLGKRVRRIEGIGKKSDSGSGGSYKGKSSNSGSGSESGGNKSWDKSSSGSKSGSASGSS